MAAAGDGASTQRLDKWIWFARIVKTRSMAARLVADGHVRVNSIRATAPAKSVRPGDVLTLSLERQVKVYRIEAAGERRGPAAEARTLYTDLLAGDRSSGDAANCAEAASERDA